jgi:hypothetical protein
MQIRHTPLANQWATKDNFRVETKVLRDSKFFTFNLDNAYLSGRFIP